MHFYVYKTTLVPTCTRRVQAKKVTQHEGRRRLFAMEATAAHKRTIHVRPTDTIPHIMGVCRLHSRYRSVSRKRRLHVCWFLASTCLLSRVQCGCMVRANVLRDIMADCVELKQVGQRYVCGVLSERRGPPPTMFAFAHRLSSMPFRLPRDRLTVS